MPRQPKQPSPPTARRPAPRPKPSLSLKLVASCIALAPFLFDRSATELLYPLFSAAPTRSAAAALPLYSTLVAIFLVQRALVKRRSSWRTQWMILGVYKVLTEGLVRLSGGRLLALGLDTGVVAGRFLLEAIPLLTTANWCCDQLDCKERANFVPAWFIPLGWAASSLLNALDLVPRILPSISKCYILQLHGLFLILVALFATHPSLEKVPRSHHRPHPAPRSLATRCVLFALALGLAHSVASTSSHCPTSHRIVPPPSKSGHILASTQSNTGVIVVGEQEIPGPNGSSGYRFRYLRADHSLLGGLWTGVSEMELHRMGLDANEVEVVKRAESIYSTFILQELVRLVKPPPDLPRRSPERALIIGLGAGLIARALDQHKVDLTVCDIDPVVYQYARQFFAVPEPSRLVLEDAKGWLASGQEKDKLFDYIVHDVFTGGQVPASLFTVEFWSLVRQRLEHSGVLAVNFAGSLSSRASKLVLSTLVYSFPHCRAFEDNPSSGSNATVGDDAVFKNLVVFCTPAWFTPVEFRRPVAADLLAYPSPQIRRAVFDRYESQEVSLDRFKLVREDEEGGEAKCAKLERDEWLLTDSNSGKLDRWQLEGAREHWKAMEKVLPREAWASW
ncbi:hypothetical protein JCM11491_004091 [Sporobolomyces phaffii]